MSDTSPDPAAVAVLDAVGVRIDGSTVLDGISWRIEPHQRWVVLGPNGSGKTTLLRVVGLQLHPLTGTVQLLGGTLGRMDVRRERRRIGVVSAAVANSLRSGISASDVVMTARHGALEPWWHDYTEADRARALALLDRFGIAALADHPFGTLSSGERQRTLLARSLMTEPELLLLDEPAAGLDIAGREQLLGDLERLADDPQAPPSVLVTHHVEEIPRGVTHALLLRHGRACAMGPIDEALTSETLGACVGMPVVVEAHDGRWTARATPAG